MKIKKRDSGRVHGGEIRCDQLRKGVGEYGLKHIKIVRLLEECGLYKLFKIVKFTISGIRQPR